MTFNFLCSPLPVSYFRERTAYLSWSLGEKRTVIYENERNTLNHAKVHFGNVGRGSTLPALRERHGRGKEGKLKSLKIGDVVIIHSEEKNRGKWPLGIVQQLYGGRDGVIRAVKLRTGKSILERPIQHLYPLELSCDDPENVARPTQLDAQAAVFRPRRDAALVARIRFRDVLQDEQLR